MSIVYEERSNSFILQSPGSTYIIKILYDKYVSHVYYGKKITHPNVDMMYEQCARASFHANPIKGDDFSNDTIPLEYSSYGTADLRSPAYQVKLFDGSRITDLTYDSYKIITGKPALKGLPQIYTNSDQEATTLKITLIDRSISLKVVLSYTVMQEFDAIIRSVAFFNEGHQPLTLLRAYSMSIDFKDSDYDYLTLSGSWARERHIVRRSISLGTQSIESRRGASGHSENPFFALLRKEATEHIGDVYGFSFIYSGNFYGGVEVDAYQTTRIQLGINSFDFSWKLEPGEEFITPEAVMVYSANGINDMSQTYHSLYQNHLVRGNYKKSLRPILINNWEATYFDFNEDKLLLLAKEASELGIELLVLDDGWFSNRNDDRSSLGDWYVNDQKLPHGLSFLSEELKKLGMQFGLWFEPEMVSEQSNLYQEHPDWCLHVHNRQKSLARHQYILDYSRNDVRDYIITLLSDILSKSNISYVKWDMNRNMTEIGSALLPPDRQMETAHRYILGVYEVMETITSRFPDVLFESCSGGGGRFDPGILYYMPQNWTSDNTDAVERLKIQYGSSLIYPPSAMTCHVSAVPNHQTGRITPLNFRFHVAMAGNFGYELDVTKLSKEEKEEVKAQIFLYKELRPIIQYGIFYRLLSPFDGNQTAWMFVSKDQTQAVVCFYQIFHIPNGPLYTIPLKGLAKDNYYEITSLQQVASGEQLLHYGLNMLEVLPSFGDFKSNVIFLKAIK